MIDAKALWRGHTPEEREAMVVALVREGDPNEGGLCAAAERLAEAVVVEPKFDRPRKCWLVEYPPDSEWYAWGHEPDETELSDHATVTEALLIPADAVVLDRETVERAILTVRAAQAAAVGVYMQTHLNELLTDLRRAAGGGHDA